MVSAEDVICVYQHLKTCGIQVWLSGGWGIDALLGKQTRLHKDLDVIMLLCDVVRMRQLLSNDGYILKELWSENCMVIDPGGIETATAFVLQDSKGREVDVHAMHLDEKGNGIPDWEEAEGFIFEIQDLTCQGMIAGYAVQCLTPEKQVFCHMGYMLPEQQLCDLERLYEKFGVGFPDEQ